jgi:predicted RNA-binding Zn-ribbon protein involved in translation (DUF1610 family)
MTDVERLFRQLVANLNHTDPARLRQPLLLSDIRSSLVPYRTNRRALQMESSEDYEVALMRLCAGEGGFVRTGPDEVRDEFLREIESPNPDLTLLDQREGAVVHLDPGALAKVLDRKPEQAYAPPPPPTPPTPPAPRPPSTPQRPTPSKRRAPPSTTPPQKCPRCNAGLPAGRVVNFCPQCGQNLVRRQCPSCKTELEPGWKHCVNCGATIA